MISKWLPKSLAWRAIALSTIWAAFSILVAAYFMGELYREASERNLRALLSTQIASLTAQIEITDEGQLSGDPDLGDVDYAVKNSGKYWTVSPASATVSGSLHSRSTGNYTIPTQVTPGDEPYPRNYQVPGPDGKTLEVLENFYQQTTTTKGKIGEKRELLIRVMRNLDLRETEISNFAQSLYFYLSLFGLGSIVVNALAILAGLNPLRKTGDALKQIREGKSYRLEGEFPPEIAPLANEMNALIDNNRRIVERSRTQVGNLAHALKTPLAVMSNEGQTLGGSKGAVIAEQTSAMQEQIQRYLQRARVGAQRESVVYRAPVTPIIVPTLRVMQKLNPEIKFHSELPKDELVFAGEAEDFQEIIGNLLENAAKWGRTRVDLKASRNRPPAGAAMLCVEISDDGPGLTDQQIAAGIKRGKRMDESKPGTGLGLSIVLDTVREYGGTVKLGKSALGGLSVIFTLPLVE
jgi:signal transduction histidine kinase